MFAGLGFVVWGGVQILVVKDWQHVAAGSAISAIGGAVSAYITKTLLDVHRLSLNAIAKLGDGPRFRTRAATSPSVGTGMARPCLERRRTAAEVSRLTASG